MKKTKLKFNTKKHTYMYDKVELMSVTTFIKKFFQPFDAKTIAKYMAKARRNKGEKCTATDIKRQWKDVAKEGTLVHKKIEEYINTGDYAEVMNRKAQNGIKWLTLKLRKLGEPTCIPEGKVFNLKYKLAGTIDLIIQHNGKGTERVITLVDWKTNPSGIKMKGYKKNKDLITGHLEDCNYIHYTLQLSLYAYLMEQNGHKIDKLYMIHLTDDKFTEYEVKYEKELIEEMLRSIKW